MLKRAHLNSNNIGFRFSLQTRKLEGLLRSFFFMEMKSKRESFKALLTDSQHSSYEWYEIILFKTYLNVQFLFLKN